MNDYRNLNTTHQKDVLEAYREERRREAEAERLIEEAAQTEEEVEEAHEDVLEDDAN